MESIINPTNNSLMNLSQSLNKDSIYIPAKTYINHTFSIDTRDFNFYDFANRKNIINLYNSSFITSISKFKYINCSDTNHYLLISYRSKINEIYLIENNGLKLKKVENSLSKCLEGEIQKLIVLENNDILAITNWQKVAYYTNNDLNYKNFFKNINKGDYVLGVIKLPEKKFGILSTNDYLTDMLVIFDENFQSEEKIIEITKPLFNIKNNIFFKTANNKMIIIGKYGFIILDINSLQIQTKIRTGLICFVLPFNEKIIGNNNEKYKYLALIIFENNIFYLKIYEIFKCIREIKKINLFERSFEFIQMFNLSNISNIYNNEMKIENDDLEIYEKLVFFDMFYDFGNDGDLIFVIHYSWKNNKSIILLNDIYIF